MNQPLKTLKYGVRRELSPLMKGVLLVVGCLSLVLGVIGIVVPLLPTTPFILFSAWCFLRSSERFHHWIVTHPRFGPIVRSWNEHRAIPLAAKRLAIITITSSLVVVWLTVGNEMVRVGVTTLLLGVSVFIWTRPSS